MSAPLRDTVAVGIWIRSQRKDQQLTLAQLAKRAGTGVRFLSELERGKESAELGKVMAVFAALGFGVVPDGMGPTPGADVASIEHPAPAPPFRSAGGGEAARFRDMLAAAMEIRDLARGAPEPDGTDPVVVRAMERGFQLLGEAARRVTPATQARLSRVPWRDLVTWRNRLVMDYQCVDRVALWRTAHGEIPALIPVLRAALTAAA